MTEILSPKEIEDLLKAISTGEVSEEEYENTGWYEDTLEEDEKGIFLKLNNLFPTASTDDEIITLLKALCTTAGFSEESINPMAQSILLNGSLSLKEIKLLHTP